MDAGLNECLNTLKPYNKAMHHSNGVGNQFKKEQ